jgi:hypothetical protein
MGYLDDQLFFPERDTGLAIVHLLAIEACVKIG